MALDARPSAVAMDHVRSRWRPAPRSPHSFLDVGQWVLEVRDEEFYCMAALRGRHSSLRPTQIKKNKEINKKITSFEFWHMTAHKLFQNAV